jgi:anti-anti-sigma regulatory factor
MLMITVETHLSTVTLRLRGRLAGPEARELVRTWSAAPDGQPKPRVVIDLTDVTSVDGIGKEFLAQVHRQGNILVAGVTTGAIVEDIVRETATDRQQGARQNRARRPRSNGQASQRS